jgi:hypothetical protein
LAYRALPIQLAQDVASGGVQLHQAELLAKQGQRPFLEILYCDLAADSDPGEGVEA